MVTSFFAVTCHSSTCGRVAGSALLCVKTMSHTIITYKKLHTVYSVSWWRSGQGIGLATSWSQVRVPVAPFHVYNPGQVVHTRVPLVHQTKPNILATPTDSPIVTDYMTMCTCPNSIPACHWRGSVLNSCCKHYFLEVITPLGQSVVRAQLHLKKIIFPTMHTCHTFYFSTFYIVLCKLITSANEVAAKH